MLVTTLVRGRPPRRRQPHVLRQVNPTTFSATEISGILIQTQRASMSLLQLSKHECGIFWRTLSDSSASTQEVASSSSRRTHFVRNGDGRVCQGSQFHSFTPSKVSRKPRINIPQYSVLMAACFRLQLPDSAYIDYTTEILPFCAYRNQNMFSF